MNTNIATFLRPSTDRSTRRRLWSLMAGGMLALPGVSQAQPTPAVFSASGSTPPPAARLLPAMPAPASSKTVVRAASPDATFDGYSVPAPSYTGPFALPRSRPQTAFNGTENPSWLKTTVGGIRDAVTGRSETPEIHMGSGTEGGFQPYGMTYAGGQAPRPSGSPMANPNPTSAAQSFMSKDFTPAGMTYAGGQQPSPNAPKASGGPVVPEANRHAPGVYAGPPAYRWYGWGSTTPGANPYSPAGQYPKGSANWYAQTGATPGAFPIPVLVPNRQAGAEPPIYAGSPHLNDAAGMTTNYTRIVSEQSPQTGFAPSPLPIPVPPAVTRPQTRFEMNMATEPPMPSVLHVTPQPIAGGVAPAQLNIAPSSIPMQSGVEPPLNRIPVVGVANGGAGTVTASSPPLVSLSPQLDPPGYPSPLPSVPNMPVGPPTVIGTTPAAATELPTSSPGDVPGSVIPAASVTPFVPSPDAVSQPMTFAPPTDVKTTVAGVECLAVPPVSGVRMVGGVVSNPEPIALGQGAGGTSNELNWTKAPAKESEMAVAPTHFMTTPVVAPAVPAARDGAPQWQSHPIHPDPIRKPEDASDVTAAIRLACDGRVSSVSVVRQSPNTITVGFTAPDETTARAVAAEIGKLTAIQSHEVRFEAVVAVK